MTSISFDNPYLLLIGIPLLLLVLVPYLIAIRKENKSKSTITSLLLHTLIIGLVSLVVAGLHMTTTNIKTETEVFVVADISYSTDRDLELIDKHIEKIMEKENLPTNAKVGVVCFGKDCKINTELGQSFDSVTKTKLDVSQTNISGALEYTSTLFSNDAIKRIVLITDGNQNTSEGTSGLISTIKNMEAKNILVDAIYVDSNLNEGEYEVQISEVEYVKSVYAGSLAQVNVLIQSNSEYVPNEDNPRDKNDSFVRLYDENGEMVAEISQPLQKGFNIATIKLDTSVDAEKENKTSNYRVVVEATHDTSKHNNETTFTQTVTAKHKILLVTKTKADLPRVQELYGSFATIDAPLLDRKPLPVSIEALCQYDEFIVSDIDLKTIDNGAAFATNLNTVVSKFGKTLLTAGNIYTQNRQETVYQILGNMTAIDYGNTTTDPKLYAIVIDTSRSMQDAYQLIMAKASAVQLLNLMEADDMVMVVSFSGDVSVIQRPTSLRNKDAIADAINAILPTQGTVLGAGLRVAYDQIKDYDGYQKQVLLISDGRSYTSVNEKDDPITITKQMYKEGIYTSVINTNSSEGVDLLTQIARIGQGGKEGIGYYFVETPNEVVEKVSTEIADDIYETVVIGETPVKIVDYGEPIVSGIATLPDIGGYYFGKAESDATVVLSVDYKRPGGGVITVPILSYRKYDQGKVVSLSTKLSGAWMTEWETNENAKAVLIRALSLNLPKEKVDYPFSFNVEYEDANATISLIPGETNPDIFVDLEIISPSEKKTTARLYYDSGIYSMDYEIEETGKYYVNAAYTYGESIFPASISFDVAYMPEYNRFELFSSAPLYTAIGNNGTVSEDGNVKIEADEDVEEVHTVYFIIPLMIAAVVLYVIDIIIRKLKWSDIKSFFKRSKAEGGAK